MSSDAERTAYCIEPAVESDWPWIAECQVEITLMNLGGKRHLEISLPVIQGRVSQQIAGIRGADGYPNQAFVVRAEDDQPAGLVWVAEIRHEATGERQGFVLSEYVAQAHRGQGLGRRLMEQAEEWAHQRDLHAIALSVANSNSIAQKLYEGLGYVAEAVRMIKNLDKTERKES